MPPVVMSPMPLDGGNDATGDVTEDMTVLVTSFTHDATDDDDNMVCDKLTSIDCR